MLFGQIWSPRVRAYIALYNSETLAPQDDTQRLRDISKSRERRD
jgi:hypothetical protein